MHVSYLGSDVGVGVSDERREDVVCSDRPLLPQRHAKRVQPARDLHANLDASKVTTNEGEKGGVREYLSVRVVGKGRSEGMFASACVGEGRGQGMFAIARGKREGLGDVRKGVSRGCSVRGGLGRVSTAAAFRGGCLNA